MLDVPYVLSSYSSISPVSLSLSTPPIERSTSLKTRKSPPNTPSRKKIVRFADALGLDLESVRMIAQDDLPTVPARAFNQLKFGSPKNGINHEPLAKLTQEIKINLPPWITTPKKEKSTLVPEFIQPISLSSFNARVRENKVCLENCNISNGAGNLSVTIVVRVLNISFEKQVVVRYTTNGWISCSEALASYVPNSCDGWSDKFTATFSLTSITPGGSLKPNQRVLFAIRFTAGSDEFWDNNSGQNYSLICWPQS